MKDIDLKDYGLPDKKKYPMPDAKHVKSAIRFFNYVSEEDEAELARNIKRKAKEYKVVIRCGKKNRLSKYISESYIEEMMANGAIGGCMYAVTNGTIKQHMAQGEYSYEKTSEYPYSKRYKLKGKKKEDPALNIYVGGGGKIQKNKLIGESNDDLAEDPDDTFFDDIVKQFDDLEKEFEPIPTDIFNEKKE